jgi:3'-phosphoadenosine 5'-phosphosulfate sulfotransferase (PAPS reductase)/FAD synthetase
VKHIVSFSGGKDSTAMLLMMFERGWPVDDIVYFDCGDWEFPQMHEHINQVEQYIGRKVTRLRNKRGDFNYWMFDHVSKPRGNNPVRIGKAWPQVNTRWCTTRKVDTIETYYSQHKPEMTVYIGFATDEINRLYSKNAQKKHWYHMRFPLFDFSMTEANCLEYCYSKGFTWGGLYNYFKRVSCWCCPLQSLKDLKQLYLHFPDLWERLKDMDRRAWNTFRADGQSVEDLEKRFYFEEVLQGKLEII